MPAATSSIDHGLGVLLGDARVEHHLQQQVAELLAQRGVVRGLDRLDRLVRLLDEVLDERVVGLLGVPRAAARGAQPVHDRDEVEQPLARRGRPVTTARRSLGRREARQHREVVGHRRRARCSRRPTCRSAATPRRRAPSHSVLRYSTRRPRPAPPSLRVRASRRAPAGAGSRGRTPAPATPATFCSWASCSVERRHVAAELVGRRSCG